MSEDGNRAVILVRKQGLSWVRRCGACGLFDVSASSDDPFICSDCRGSQHQPELPDDRRGED
jgi:hypothetical protein